MNEVAYKQNVFITHSSVGWNVVDSVSSEELFLHRGMDHPVPPQSTFTKTFIYSSIVFKGRLYYTTQVCLKLTIEHRLAP